MTGLSRHAVRTTEAAWEDTLRGRPGARPRPLIGASWRRALGHGVDPWSAVPSRRLPDAEVEARRHGSGLADLQPVIAGGLLPGADPAEYLTVVTDADGIVLWRGGDPAVLRASDRLGLGVGVPWTEEAVGTNGVGTALVAREPVLVRAGEHFVHAQHPWTCAAAPVTDPRTGRLLGAVDVGGPAKRMPAAALALVSAVARLTEGELRSRHWAAVERMRAVAAPMLARLPGRALVVDADGWVAGVTGMAPADQVALPKDPSPGPCWLPAYGHCTLEPLPGGWLIRADADAGEQAPGRVVLDLRARTAVLSVSGAAGTWSRDLRPRHAELLYLLALHRTGRSAAQLAQELFGDPERRVTVRAELSRLRRHLAGVLAHRPYRFRDGLEVELLLPARPADLLPHSTAPGVVAGRV